MIMWVLLIIDLSGDEPSDKGGKRKLGYSLD
jgi:hypothetical protein